jgi:hypothetical protein
MKEKQNDSQVSVERLVFPIISWRSEFWLAFIPFAFSLVPLAFPNLPNLDWYKERGTSFAIILFLFPFLIPLTIWVVRSFVVSVKRIHKFSLLFAENEKHKGEVREIRQNVSELLERMSGQKAFDVSSAFIGQKNDFYILMPMVKGVKLQKGNVLVVVDTHDGMAMGFFEIIQIKAHEYLAEGKSGIDPLWLGYVKEQRNVSVLPYFIAVYVPQGGQNDK